MEKKMTINGNETIIYGEDWRNDYVRYRNVKEKNY